MDTAITSLIMHKPSERPTRKDELFNKGRNISLTVSQPFNESGLL